MQRSFNARALGLSLNAEQTIDLAAAHGFDAVDLLVRDVIASGTAPATLRRRMDDRGLRGGAWPLPMNWREENGRFAEDLQRLPRFAEAAAMLGLSRTATWVLPETPRAPHGERECAAHRAEVMRWHVERLGAIARILAEHGTRLGLEVIGVTSFRSGKGLPFVTKLGDIGPLLDALREEGADVGLLVDAYHLFAAGESVEDALVCGIEPIVWVHVADLPLSADPHDLAAIRDNDRGLPGENGAVPCRDLLRLLAERGYAGPVTVETLPGCRSLADLTPDQVARKTAEALESVWPSPIGK